MERKNKILKFSALAFALVLCCCMILPAATPVQAASGISSPAYTSPYDFSLTAYRTANSPSNAVVFDLPRYFGSDADSYQIYENGYHDISTNFRQDASVPINEIMYNPASLLKQVNLNSKSTLFVSKEDGLPYLDVVEFNDDLSVNVYISGYWIIETNSGRKLESFTKTGGRANLPAGTVYTISNVLASELMEYDAIVTSISIQIRSLSSSSSVGIEELIICTEVWTQTQLIINADAMRAYFPYENSQPVVTPPDAPTESTPYASAFNFKSTWFQDSDDTIGFSHSYPTYWSDLEEQVSFTDSTVMSGAVSIFNGVPVVGSTMTVNGDVYRVDLELLDPIFVSKDTGLPYLTVGCVDANIFVRVYISGSKIHRDGHAVSLEPFTLSQTYSGEAEEQVLISDVLVAASMTNHVIIDQLTVSVYSLGFEQGFGLDTFRAEFEVWDSAARAANRTLIHECISHFTFDPDAPAPEASKPHVCPTIPGETVYVGVVELGPGIEAIGNSLFDIRITEHFVVGDFVVIIIGVCIFALVLKLFAGGK